MDLGHWAPCWSACLMAFLWSLQTQCRQSPLPVVPRESSGPAETAQAWSCLVGWGAWGAWVPVPPAGLGVEPLVSLVGSGSVLGGASPGSARKLQEDLLCLLAKELQAGRSWELGEAPPGSFLSPRSRALRGLVAVLGDPWGRFCGGPGPFVGPAPGGDAGSKGRSRSQVAALERRTNGWGSFLQVWGCGQVEAQPLPAWGSETAAIWAEPPQPERAYSLPPGGRWGQASRQSLVFLPAPAVGLSLLSQGFVL